MALRVPSVLNREPVPRLLSICCNAYNDYAVEFHENDSSRRH
jgi:hypothetical protein